jgi:hypothetical protein
MVIQSMESNMSEEVITSFTGAEYAYIEKLLRQVYSIRTATGEEDDALSDFIDAIASGDTITLE